MILDLGQWKYLTDDDDLMHHVTVQIGGPDPKLDLAPLLERAAGRHNGETSRAGVRIKVSKVKPHHADAPLFNPDQEEQHGKDT